MQPTLFYAWQSDADKKTNRRLIHEAAEKALKSIVAEGVVEDAPRLDHDTRDASGMPEIVGTIFEKIKSAGLFLADVTLVGKIERPDKAPKLTPNPNILIELGYAAGIMGWDRIILVLNKHYGPPEELPFDLKNRPFPVTYNLAPGDDKAEARRALAKELAGRIKLAMAAEHDRVSRTISQLTLPALYRIKNTAKYKQFWTEEDDPAVAARDRVELHQALEQLLRQGVIKTDVIKKLEQPPPKPPLVKYGYVWTYFGQLVLQQLGLRDKAALSGDSQKNIEEPSR